MSQKVPESDVYFTKLITKDGICLNEKVLKVDAAIRKILLPFPHGELPIYNQSQQSIPFEQFSRAVFQSDIRPVYLPTASQHWMRPDYSANVPVMLPPNRFSLPRSPPARQFMVVPQRFGMNQDRLPLHIPPRQSLESCIDQSYSQPLSPSRSASFAVKHNPTPIYSVRSKPLLSSGVHGLDQSSTQHTSTPVLPPRGGEHGVVNASEVWEESPPVQTDASYNAKCVYQDNQLKPSSFGDTDEVNPTSKSNKPFDDDVWEEGRNPVTNSPLAPEDQTVKPSGPRGTHSFGDTRHVKTNFPNRPTRSNFPQRESDYDNKKVCDYVEIRPVTTLVTRCYFSTGSVNSMCYLSTLHFERTY
ncbi:uncharacterized protein LOC100372159 [Saccoglossus kowalevskii]